MSRGKLPIVKPDELIRALEKVGFTLLRKSKGGHQRFGHADARKTTVPVHKGKTIGRGLLRKILRDVGMTAEELKELL
ncbi:MAG: type II toxin-antitoxin system HicA family toxin [Gemmataceae bacterium]|nr:type II toxin-antitoxin system HicA family toxin [Gemmataceae bacterium]